MQASRRASEQASEQASKKARNKVALMSIMTSVNFRLCLFWLFGSTVFVVSFKSSLKMMYACFTLMYSIYYSILYYTILFYTIHKVFLVGLSKMESL